MSVDRSKRRKLSRFQPTPAFLSWSCAAEPKFVVAYVVLAVSFVPGRVEHDIVETEPVFCRRDGELVHAGGMPTRLDTFERAGVDVHRILGGGG